MNNDLSVISDIFEPNKITIKKNVYIIESSDKKLVLKKKNDKVLKAYRYLNSRGFNNYVPLIDNNRSNYLVYPFYEEEFTPYEQKGEDLAKLTALMHAKTTYFKEVDQSKYDDLYNDLLENISYLSDYYSSLYDSILLKEYYDPSENLFMDFYSKINNALDFSRSELEKWYQEVDGKKTQRVSLVHNNLSLEHYIKSTNDYLISFDKSKIDSPVVDLAKLFKNEYDKLDFSQVFEKYLYTYSLNSDELKLFFILISIPYEVKFENNIYENTLNIYNLIYYLNKAEDLIRPYYSNDEKEE